MKAKGLGTSPGQIPSNFSELDIQFGRFLVRLSGKDSPEIFLAAALASSLRREGHICLNLSSLAGKAIGEEKEGWVCPGIEPWVDSLKQSPMVGNPGDFRPLILEGSRLYLYRYWNYEKHLAETLTERATREDLPADISLLKKGLSRLFPGEDEGEVNWQKVGAALSVLKSLCVISGGPGTGKTFTVAGMLALHLEQAGGRALRISLAAPTGKAAARLKESIHGAKERLNAPREIIAAIPEEASTLHRLLGGIPGSPYFQYNAENPLPVDLLVVDESSMVDLALLSKLAQAVPKEARLILLGDKDQLASVEAGAVLGDICDAGGIHRFSESLCRSYREVAGEDLRDHCEVCGAAGIQDTIVQLKKSYRFGPTSGIGAVSRAVNDGDGEEALRLLQSGEYPDIHWRDLVRPEFLGRTMGDHLRRGFSFLKAKDPEEALNCFSEFRILSPLREGPYGIHALNLIVEEVLGAEGWIQRESPWYKGRPVLITKNDYQLRLFNGDIGIVFPDPKNGDELRAFLPSVEGGLRSFPPLRLPEHETVYAMTVHKSQGSEFDRVLIVLPERDSPLLTRELIYTAFTRAKGKVEIWGNAEVFRAAVSRRIERTSGLRDRLWK